MSNNEQFVPDYVVTAVVGLRADVATALESVGVGEQILTDSTAARDAALGYRDDTLTARDVTLTYRDSALAAQTASETAQTATETARDVVLAAEGSLVADRDAAIAARTGAEAAQAASETAKTDAETAKTGAETAQTVAESAQTASESAKTGAETAETAAGIAQAASEAAKTGAETARNVTLGYRNEAETFKDQAEAAAASSTADMAKSVYDSNDDGKVDAADTADSAPWAGITGKPTEFTPADHDASKVTTGIFDVARFPPAALNQLPVISTGGIADLSAGQQSDIVQGREVITTDGRYWRYDSGDKTLEASYIEIADKTPDWAAIANKPPAFPIDANNPLLVGRYQETVGDGTATSFTITHNLNTLDIQVSGYEISTGAEVDFPWERTDANSISVTATPAVAANDLRITILK